MNANRACGPLLSLDCWRYSDRSIDRWNKQKLTRIITKWLDLDRKKKFVFSNFLLNDILIEEFMRNWARIKWSRTCTESCVHMHRSRVSWTPSCLAQAYSLQSTFIWWNFVCTVHSINMYNSTTHSRSYAMHFHR